MRFLESTFPLMVLIFTVTNLLNMGLQVKIDGVIAALKNKKAIALTIVWGWVVGPALALLIARVLSLAEPYVVGLLLSSLAPVTPFLPLTVEEARGDMNFAGALVPLVMVGTVVLMPLMGPLLIRGVTVSAWALGKPLLLSVLLPLAIGAAIRHYARTAATRMFPAVNVLAKITTVSAFVWGVVAYAQAMIETVGSFAFLSVVLFTVVIAVIAYLFGFGLKQSQRSVMSLAMLTRNGGPVLIAALAIPGADSRILTFVILLNVGGFVIAPIAARAFRRRAGTNAAAAV